MVTSKGGTTEAALSVFTQYGFDEMMTEAIEKASQRAKELSK
jgi:pyrroline-5-carboxylate reductase